MKKLKFEELNLSKEVLHAVSDLGYEEATPIQTEAIPVIMKGKDIIGQAQTGTGKTAAFGIPAIESININNKKTQVMILCPTRELAVQVAEEMNKLSKYLNISIHPVYGGQSIERQLKILRKGVQIIIGTPGRIIDHIERGSIELDELKMVVLDEADEMLDMGFREDIELILKQSPKKRQTVLFSATMAKPILELTKRFQNNPVHIKVIHEVLTVANTEQFYFEVKHKNKLEALTRLIDINNLKLSLVFCNTKRGVDELVDQLKVRGYSVDGLHGDIKQSGREKVLDNFRKGKIEILVATDVAARGLDIEKVEAVFNYDMPQDEEYYVHRIGRTGRAGKSGKAFSFVSGRDIIKLRDIQKYIKTKIKLLPIPSFDDVEAVRANIFIAEIKSLIEKGKYKKYQRYITNLIDEEYTSFDVAAALFSLYFEENENAKENISNHIDDSEVRLFINIGKKDKAGPGDLVGAIAGESGISGKEIGEIDMFDKFSFVNVPGKYAEKIINKLSGRTIKKRKVNVEIAAVKK